MEGRKTDSAGYGGGEETAGYGSGEEAAVSVDYGRGKSLGRSGHAGTAADMAAGVLAGTPAGEAEAVGNASSSTSAGGADAVKNTSADAVGEGRCIRRVLYVAVQCTWGAVQTLAGAILFLQNLSCAHSWYQNAVRTQWEKNSGVSLGLFIFTPKGADQMAVHEYGHTYQSLFLGPLYLFIIGIPSCIWNRSERYRRLRAEYGVPYSFCFAEGWADRLGEKMTGMRSDGS